jgi:ATP-dependent DNA helicase RecQ
MASSSDGTAATLETADGSPRPASAAVDRPLDARVAEALGRVWGFDRLRPLQAEAIDLGVRGRDGLVVLPTGGGKSLCFQVPPLVDGRLRVVVSPLISLMKDQVDGLRAVGYPAAALHSAMDAQERHSVLDGLRDGLWKLLYVSPERLALDGFAERLRASDVAGFAIDEAHCISHWGHDFRPEYRQLRELRHRFPAASIQAFTATATPQVRGDVCEQLGLRDPEILVGSFDRPNLTYRMVFRERLADQVAEAIQRHDGDACIVYCISRKDTEQLAEQLGKRGIEAAAYHAGLPTARRLRLQEQFSRERLNVIVATVAFGMGIDRSDVRCVIHAAMPKSVDAFQQETGRAGRDGLASECLLLHDWSDVERWRYLSQRSVEESGGDRESREEILRIHESHLQAMIGICGTPSCRRRAILAHFGQTVPPGSCGACDVCLGEVPELSDAADAAKRILSCVWRLKERFGIGQLVDVLRGRATDAVQRWGHDQLSTFGIMAGQPAARIRNLVHQLVHLGLLERTGGDRPIVRLGPGAGAVLRGEEPVRLFEPPGVVRRAAAGEEQEWDGVDRDLFERLKSLRSRLAAEAGIAAYLVFNDRTLRELAAVAPLTPAAMRGVHGVGERKLEQFGGAFLAAIADHLGDAAAARAAAGPGASAASAAGIRPAGHAAASSRRRAESGA